jgi:hypothetical protein
MLVARRLSKAKLPARPRKIGASDRNGRRYRPPPIYFFSRLIEGSFRMPFRRNILPAWLCPRPRVLLEGCQSLGRTGKSEAQSPEITISILVLALCVLALACQLQHAFYIGAGRAAVLLSIRRYTGASWMSAFRLRLHENSLYQHGLFAEKPLKVWHACSTV